MEEQPELSKYTIARMLQELHKQVFNREEDEDANNSSSEVEE